jgi:peptide deformylase
MKMSVFVKPSAIGLTRIAEAKNDYGKRTNNTMIYPIVIYGSQTLRNPSENIAPDYPDLAKLVEDMFLTLGEADGVGLAAPQIGKNIRLFVVDCTPWGEDHPELADYRRAFINAEIYERSEETSLFNEGCLSLPGLHEDVRRPVSIRMRYVDEKFVEHDEEFTGLPARVIQHEYDHIEGKVFTDRLSPLRRNLLKSKLQRLAGGKYRCSYKTK